MGRQVELERLKVAERAFGGHKPQLHQRVGRVIDEHQQRLCKVLDGVRLTTVFFEKTADLTLIHRLTTSPDHLSMISFSS